MADEIKHFVSSPTGQKGLRSTNSSTRQVRATSIEKAQKAMQPCEEPIDLRNLFPDDCFTHKHGTLTHYLDDAAIQFFHQQVKRYGNKYTLGVNLAVLKHASARFSAPTTDSSTPTAVGANNDEIVYKPPAIIPVGYSQHRGEVRLNFATDIEIELPNGNVLMARSVDISPSGMQVRLPDLLEVVEGMELDVFFPTLEEEHEQEFGAVNYVLMSSAIGSMYMTLKLARVKPGDHPFDVFIEDFISSKKHRYRVDAEDSRIAMTAKAWEYLYVKALPHLVAFVSTSDDKIKILELAISDQNVHQTKGLGNSMLSSIEHTMSKLRLQALAQRKGERAEIYACRYQGTGLRRRLCARSWEFEDEQQRQLFLSNTANLDTFRAWRIEVVPLSEIPEQRSLELLEKLAEESVEQSDALINQLNQCEYLMYLVDITAEIRREPLLIAQDLQQTEDYFFDQFEIRRKASAEYTRLRLGIGRQRNEDRYIYQSPIELKFYGEKLRGKTLDLSVNGLKIQLETPKTFQLRDAVAIDFLGLRKKFKTAKNLTKEAYRVAACTQSGIVCLTRDYRVSNHKAAVFIDKLIKNNQGVLPSCTGERWMSTKARLMETWLNHCLPAQALLVTRHGSNYDVPYLLTGANTSEVMAPFSIGKDLYHLEELLNVRKLRLLIRQLPAADKPLTTEIYVEQRIDLEEQSIVDITVADCDDFKDDLQRAEYVASGLTADQFKCYKVSLSKIPRLEKVDLIDDIKMIRRNARHQLSEFEEEFKAMVAITELVDITDIVLERYNLS
jgi:hypothetical protein